MTQLMRHARTEEFGQKRVGHINEKGINIIITLRDMIRIVTDRVKYL